MKKLKIFLLIVGLIFANVCFTQSGWFWLNPLPTGNNLRNIQFVNTFTGYAVGDFGVISKTTNSGNSWTTTNSLINLNSVFFVNVNTGFVVGAKGEIRKTTNGGLNWYSQFSGTSEDLNSVCFADNNVGLIVGGSTYYTSVILRTTNAGLNWSLQTNLYRNNLTSVCFTDFQNSFATGLGGTLLKSTNAGISWDSIYINQFQSYYCVRFTNASTGYVTSSGMILKTTNAGLNWSSQTVSINRPLYSIWFTNDNSGYAIGADDSYGAVSYRTSNGGANWINVIVPSINSNMYSVHFTDPLSGYSVGEEGRIIKTTNGGSNWFGINTNVNRYEVNAVYFIDDNTGYIGGVGGLLKTTNGGENWNSANFDITTISSIFFIDNMNGLVGGFQNPNSGVLYKTTNGCASWFPVKSMASTHFESIYFVGLDTGYCVTGQAFLKTTNKGNNWVHMPNEFGGFNDVVFTTRNTGYICGYDSKIFKTTNSGINWFLNFSGAPSTYLSSISFTNAETGFAVGLNTIMKTTNSGSNWFYQYSTNANLHSIEFLNENTGYIAGGNLSNSKTLRTTDGGNSWMELATISSGYLNSVFFPSVNIGYVVGDNGTVLKTTDGGGLPISIEFSSINIPIDYALSQNYPNPFNPQTKIKFAVPSNVKGQTSNVKLVIYDLLGREVVTLVNEELKPGTYEADWDASNYSSGVYFYKIISNDFVETKKMVLMK